MNEDFLPLQFRCDNCEQFQPVNRVEGLTSIHVICKACGALVRTEFLDRGNAPRQKLFQVLCDINDKIIVFDPKIEDTVKADLEEEFGIFLGEEYMYIHHLKDEQVGHVLDYISKQREFVAERDPDSEADDVFYEEDDESEE